MSYPFYCQYPASKRHTAFQHPCRSLFAAAALVAGPFTFPNPAFAALNCTTQPSCASLGYSQDYVENCSKYIKCPFDTTYKACTAINCSSYTKTSCPEGAESCSKCSAGGHSFYKIDACKDGYTAKYGYILRPGTGSGTIVGGGSLVVDQDKWNGSSASVSTRSATTAATQTTATSATTTDVKDFTTSDTLVDWNDRVDAGDTVDWGDLVNPGGSQIIKPIGKFITDCVVNSCTGYNLTSCPTNGSCSECVSGTTTKYKLDTCNSGYAKVNDTCVKAYASCEAAGYLTSEPANAHCVSTYDIYLTNGTKVTCYSSSSCSCNDGYNENENGQCVKDCSGYTLTKCPENAASCSECNDGTTTKYKIDKCINDNFYGLYNGECIPLCEVFANRNNPIINNKDTSCGSGARCLDGSTMKYACLFSGVWISRTENSNGSYSYRCTTTVGDGDKIAYILSDMTGNCSPAQGSGRRGGTCDGSTISGVYVSSGKEIKLCSVFPVSNGSNFAGDKCYTANDNVNTGLHNANMIYGTTKTVRFKNFNNTYTCTINGASSIPVMFKY